MFETFATMHQEQSSFLNRELEQLRQLSQELQTLRAIWNARRGCSWNARRQRPALTNGGSHHLATIHARIPCMEANGVRPPSPSHDSGSQRGSGRQNPRRPLRPDHAPSARATIPMAENPLASYPARSRPRRLFDPNRPVRASRGATNAKRGQITAESCCRGSTPDDEFAIHHFTFPARQLRQVVKQMHDRSHDLEPIGWMNVFIGREDSRR